MTASLFYNGCLNLSSHLIPIVNLIWISTLQNPLQNECQHVYTLIKATVD